MCKRDQKLITVIVTAYNIEKYLDRCIESLVMQTYPHLEIILVDDGSTDQTGAICDYWAGKDERIAVIHKKNGGVSDARNAGVRKASGKWIGFVDGDDYVSVTMYEHLYRHRVEQGITVCGMQTEENGILRPYPAIDKLVQPREAVDLYLFNELQALCSGSFTYWGCYPVNKLYDRDLFTHVLYPVGQTYEDIYVFFELLHKAVAIQFFPTCEYIYVQRSDSITHDNSNIVPDSLRTRLWQKEQLLKYWCIVDSRIEKIITCEYFFILYRYACFSAEMRKKHRETADKAWKKLQERGYDFFPLKMKLKVFLFVHCPGLYNWVRKWKLKIKR